MTWRVELGDSRERLRELADASIDAVVTDPPYELGFMGKKWDASGIAYDVGLWGEVLRVLKPGGHLLAFGAARTYHRMAVAIEDAGFEIRDSIHWVYGSGFPKSLDVSKAIDKTAGAERLVVGERKLTGTARIVGGQGGATSGLGAAAYEGATLRDTLPITAPATDEAKTWSGWGTALKPSHEPIVVARKPLDGTVAANVLAHGVGAINVEGCRVGGGGERRMCGTTDQSGATSYTLGARTESYTHTGRWPPNTIFSHLPECRQVGTKRVKTGCAVRHNGVRGGAIGPPGAKAVGTPDMSYAGPDGLETVEAWECAAGCPVAELDAQTPDLKRHGNTGPSVATIRTNVPFGPPNRNSGAEYNRGDEGGASRFFPAFRYQAKPARSERDAGLSRFKMQRTGGMSATVNGSMKTGSGNDRETVGANIHPTVKPVELMRWLVRLVTPKGGTVLDPFTGSGTTGCAAILERCSFVGVELSDDYRAIACARIEAAESGRPCEQLDLFGGW